MKNKALYDIILRWRKIGRAIDRYIIKDWKYSSRCIQLNDLRKKLEISHFDIYQNNFPLDKCLLYFELIYNLLQVLLDKYHDVKDRDIEIIDEEDVYKIIDNIEGVLEELNYKMEKVEDKYLIVEKDIIATSVAEKNPDICGDIIEYRRFNLKGEVETKKAIILKLAEKIEPLRKKFKGTSYNMVMEELQMILNNLNLRHNNLEGTNKKEYIVNMSKEELEKWYDKTYDMILCVLTLNDYLDIKNDIEDLKKKL